MKKLIVTLLFLSIFSTSAFADEDEGYWPRSYFAGLGFSAVVTKGDIGKYTIDTKTEQGEKETVHLPSLNVLLWPDIMLGVNIGQFSLSANYNYWYYGEELGGIPEGSVEEQVRFWRFGVEFIYNFYWPEYFQPGIGIGYTYTSIKTDNSVFPADMTKEKTYSELMGSAIALIFDIRYYWTENLILQPSLKFYESWFSNLYTEHSGTNELVHTKWQTFAAIELAIQYQF